MDPQRAAALSRFWSGAKCRMTESRLAFERSVNPLISVAEWLQGQDPPLSHQHLNYCATEVASLPKGLCCLTVKT